MGQQQATSAVLTRGGTVASIPPPDKGTSKELDELRRNASILFNDIDRVVAKAPRGPYGLSAECQLRERIVSLKLKPSDLQNILRLDDWATVEEGVNRCCRIQYTLGEREVSPAFPLTPIGKKAYQRLQRLVALMHVRAALNVEASYSNPSSFVEESLEKFSRIFMHALLLVKEADNCSNIKLPEGGGKNDSPEAAAATEKSELPQQLYAPSADELSFCRRLLLDVSGSSKRSHCLRSNALRHIIRYQPMLALMDMDFTTEALKALGFGLLTEASEEEHSHQHSGSRDEPSSSPLWSWTLMQPSPLVCDRRVLDIAIFGKVPRDKVARDALFTISTPESESEHTTTTDSSNNRDRAPSKTKMYWCDHSGVEFLAKVLADVEAPSLAAPEAVSTRRLKVVLPLTVLILERLGGYEALVHSDTRIMNAVASALKAHFNAGQQKRKPDRFPALAAKLRWFKVMEHYRAIDRLMLMQRLRKMQRRRRICQAEEHQKQHAPTFNYDVIRIIVSFVHWSVGPKGFLQKFKVPDSVSHKYVHEGL